MVAEQPPGTQPPARIAVVGGSFSGNKGAASMLQAVVDGLPSRVPQVMIDVLSPYPDADRKEPTAAGVNVLSWRPVDMIAGLPLAVLAGILRGVGARLPLPGTLDALRRADVVIDVSGISFVDGRGLVILVYNVLQVLIPRILGTPVVKGAQALGPFAQSVNRAAARFVLPRVASIAARGARTAAHLEELKLDNVIRADDLAFLLDVPPEAGDIAQGVVDGAGPAPRVVVVPSAVVEGYAQAAGLDYVQTMARTIDGLVEDLGCSVILMPHAVRQGAGAGRMNDLPVSQAIHGAVTNKDRCLLVERALTAHELRGIIERCEVAITARFHAMVSALAVATPVVVVGWSHKYHEVMSAFGMEEHVLPYEQMEPKALVSSIGELLEHRVEIRARLLAALPPVRESAERNFAAVIQAMRGATLAGGR